MLTFILEYITYKPNGGVFKLIYHKILMKPMSKYTDLEISSYFFF